MVDRHTDTFDIELEQPLRDGRRRRHQRSRGRILHALADALSEPDIEITPEQIAARSGYSISTIFRHFGGQQELAAAMQDLVSSKVRDHLAAGPFEGDMGARVRALVRRLAAVSETVAPFLRVTERARPRTQSEAGRRQLDTVVRSQIAAALPQELAALPADTADILAALLSVATWSHMRRTQDHTAERATVLLESAVFRLLGESPAGDSPR